jgi:hypothetical protein
MRQELIDYINTLNLGGFYLTEELPWETDGSPLYLKNLKKIYVDTVQYANEPIITTLDGLTISNQQRVIRLYFASDAKQVSPDYDDLISDLRGAKDVTLTDGAQRRQVDVATSFTNDLLITEMVYTFTNLST